MITIRHPNRRIDFCLIAPVLAVLCHLGCSPLAGEQDEFPEPGPPVLISVDPTATDWERERREWFEEAHRCAPGTDWREIERRNRREALRNRARLREALKNDAASSPSGEWVEVGSRNLAGRTHQVALDQANDVIYVGSDRGGLWKGRFDADQPDTTGMRWRPVSDDVMDTARTVLCLRDDPRVLLKPGDDLARSVDGGATWETVPTVWGYPRRILSTGGSPETIFVVTQYSSSRLFRSRDGGATFEVLRQFSGPSDADIWTPRGTPGPLYVLKGNELEVTYDDGDTWDVVGVLPVEAVEVTLTGSEAGAPSLYAIVDEDWGEGPRLFLRSRDAGVTWEQVQEVVDFWWIHSVSLAASTLDPDLVVYGGVDGYRSTDGGETFARINNWTEYYTDPETKLHADLPALDFVPLDGGGEILFISTDGGTYFSTDGGVTFRNMTLWGLRVSQYYSVLSDKDDHTRIYAGSQDQGFQFGQSATGGFSQLTSGDFGYLTSSDGSHDLVFAVYPRTSRRPFVLAVERDDSGQRRLIRPWIEIPDVDQSWMAPIQADPDDRNRFLYGGRFIYRFDRVEGDRWAPTRLPHDFQVQDYEVVRSLAVARTIPRTWYAGTTKGRLWYSTDDGENWTQAVYSGYDDLPRYFPVLDIHVDPQRPNEVFVSGSGYSNPSVFRSTDGGRVFEAFAAGLPETSVFSLTSDFSRSRDLYAATYAGPYRFDGETGTWTSLIGLDAPMTPFRDVEFLSDRLRFATYGRGIWDYLPADLRERRRSGGRRVP